MSIKFRKNPLSSTEDKIDFKSDENLEKLVKRALYLNSLSEFYLDSYQVVLNGHQIPRDMWTVTSVHSSDSILILPILHKGEGGAILKTAVIIAVTVYVGGIAGKGVSAALITAGATIGATLILNSLFPPPELPGLGGFGADQAEDSQMYNVSGQANATKKYGKVPKVYGVHRMYPNVAANPYVDLTTENGQVVQYFVAVYDFGIGPSMINDIRIGNTPIDEFFDVQYNIVDLNRPVVEEGYWDDNVKTEFQYYKQDVEFDAASVVLEKNQFDVPVQPLSS
jgi:hypothetical protein